MTDAMKWMLGDILQILAYSVATFVILATIVTILIFRFLSQKYDNWKDGPD